MSLLDPDSNTAHRFQRDRIAQDIFTGVMTQIIREWDGRESLFPLAMKAFSAADQFLIVKKGQPSILPDDQEAAE